MAGFKVKNVFQRLRIRIQNWFIRRRKRKNGKAINEAAGRKPFLTGGVWIDENKIMYNCMGKCIGKFEGIKEEE